MTSLHYFSTKSEFKTIIQSKSILLSLCITMRVHSYKFLHPKYSIGRSELLGAYRQPFIKDSTAWERFIYAVARVCFFDSFTQTLHA